MKFEFFIAKRIIDTKSYKSSVSGPIIKIGITAIALSLVVMLIAVSTNRGLQQKIRDKAIAFNGHISISNFDSNTSQAAQVPVSKQQEFYPEFFSVEGVSHIQAVAHKFGIIRTPDDFEGLFLKGVGPDYEWSYFETFLVEGKLPSYGKSYSNEVLISQYLSNRLNLYTGDSFQMYFMKTDTSRPPSVLKYTVTGVFDSGFEELDRTYLIGDINHVQRLNKWSKDQVGHFEVFVNDYGALESIANLVYQQTPSDLNTETVTQKYASIFEWIQIFDKNTYGILVIIILVATINMMTALLVLILERTPTIGILKALGSQDWSIRQLFLYTASYLILLGMFWGNTIGLGLLWLQKSFKLITLNPAVYYVTEVPVHLDFVSILGLNVMTFLLCLLMLLIPSYVITKITPVKSIRFQ